MKKPRDLSRGLSLTDYEEKRYPEWIPNIIYSCLSRQLNNTKANIAFLFIIKITFNNFLKLFYIKTNDRFFKMLDQYGLISRKTTTPMIESEVIT